MLCRLGQCKGMSELEHGRQSCARGSSDVGGSPGTDLNPSLCSDCLTEKDVIRTEVSERAYNPKHSPLPGSYLR